MTKSADPAPRVPRYREIEDHLLAAIAGGRYPAGSTLPTEHALCAAYDASRITIRRALDGLAGRRLVTRTPGRGTMVSHPDEMVKSIALTGYIDDAIPLNRHRVIDDAMVRPTPAIAALLQVPERERIRRIRSVNHSGELPLSYGQFWFPARTAALIRVEDFAGAVPPIRVVESRSGLAVAGADQVVDAAVAGADVARRLGIAKGTPVLRAHRVYHSAERLPLEAVDVHYHPERYRYRVTLLPKIVPLHRAPARP